MDAEAYSQYLEDWDTCWTSPLKKKKKKQYKKAKDQNGKIIKGDVALKRESSTLKKKKQKDTKFKEEMKKKKKKKKKNSKKDEESVNLGLDDSFTSTQGDSAHKKKKNNSKKKDKESVNLGLSDSFTSTQGDIAPNPVAQCIRSEQTSAIKPATSNKQIDTQAKPNKVTSDFISPKTPKTKKKVAFDLLPGYSCAKRPKLIASPPPQTKDSSFSETEKMRDNGELQYGTQTGQSTGDDLNSQDLFITQKTFRSPSPEPSSSSENMEEAIFSIPLIPREQFRGKRPPSPHLMRNHAASDIHQRHSQRPAQHELPPLHQETRKPKKPDQDVTNLTEETHAQHQKNQPPPCLKPINKPSRFPLISTTNTSTQTENLFTTELSFFLRFRQESKVKESSEDLKPVDLSLPQRTRAQLGSCLSCPGKKTSALGVKYVADKHGNLHLSSSPVEIKDESEEELICSAGDNKEKKGGTDETPPSPQSEPEPKSTDTTTSSEDSDLWRLTQVRAVQTKLNESFFFKPKGDGQSPRPDSPLMKFYKGRKSGKKH